MTRRPTPGCAAKNQKLNVAAGVPRQQRGVVLLIALIMLVAMTVVGLSMLLSLIHIYMCIRNRHYRFRVYEKVCPLRNMVGGGDFK